MLLIFCISFAFAQTAEPITETKTSPCPNLKKLRALCAYVGSITEDPEPQGKYKYLYQRKVFEADCVDINKDSEEEIARKVSKLWKENEDQLICNNTRFEVGNGNIIKFAVNTAFDRFISDMAIWKVDLNKVDETDGRTVLDYVKYKMERAKGSSTERVLSFYYRTFRSAGAFEKHLNFEEIHHPSPMGKFISSFHFIIVLVALPFFMFISQRKRHLN